MARPAGAEPATHGSDVNAPRRAVVVQRCRLARNPCREAGWRRTAQASYLPTRHRVVGDAPVRSSFAATGARPAGDGLRARAGGSSWTVPADGDGGEWSMSSSNPGYGANAYGLGYYEMGFDDPDGPY